MSFRPETEALLKDVEALTGSPVEIFRDPELPYLARITRAKPGVPAHILRINPTRGEPDYLIAYESAFILRLFQVPPDQRYEFATADKGRDAVAGLVSRAGQLASLPAAALTELTNQLYEGILVQLRSYPLGLRIDRWLYTDYPGLRDLQIASAAEQQQDNLQILSPEVRSFAPKPIYNANASMNAAYAIFFDRVFGKAGYAVPYRSAGFEKGGRRLLDLLESVPDEPEHDRDLVDAWADEMDLSGWYTWKRIDS